jgi:GT2 family glycosyltransferase
MAMNHADITITAAICTRQRAEQLQRALESLVSQATKPLEILVVDNAPEDSATRDAVKAVAGVRYVVEPVPGLDFARNRALREARGDVVAFLDDDAQADADWCGAITRAFAEHPQLAACTGRVEAMSTEAAGQVMFEANGGFSRGHNRVLLPRDATKPLHGRRAPLIAWAVSVGAGCSLAVRRESALAIGGFDEALDMGPAMPGGGDHDMLWRLLMSGGHTLYEPAALAWHEHRRDADAAVRQIAGHQRALTALLVKCAVEARGHMRGSILLFLAWRLSKPIVRMARRLLGRDPLPMVALLRMTGECWRGLAAYPAARREAEKRRRQFGGEQKSPIDTVPALVAGALSGRPWSASAGSLSQGNRS